MPLHAFTTAPQPDLMSVIPVSDAAKADLLARMTRPDRLYHNMAHLDLLWRRHLEFAGRGRLALPRCDILVASAIGFHDAVLVPGARDNEALSAALWWEVSATQSDLSETERSWVAETIRATANHVEAARTIDRADDAGLARQWVLDLDLTPLGEEPDVFDQNLDLLVAEGESSSAEERRSHLIEVLKHYAAASPLYHCPPIATVFESAAHRNFERHLNKADPAGVKSL